MKAIFFCLVFLSFFYSISINSQGIIIDHNCIAVDQIPPSYIADIKNNIRFQWCGQSHSNQVPCGLNVLESLHPEFNSEVAEMVLPTAAGAMNVYIGNQGFNSPGQCCTSITPEGYWIGEGIGWTNECLAYNPTLNVSGFLWCWQLESNGSSYVQSYLEQMEIFEAEHPNVTFVYTTANAQAYGAAGLQRHQNNEMIRHYCISHNKVLFDFGDLDSWYNGEQNTTTFEGETYPVQHNAFDGQECGHLNLLGTEYKARAIWWMMARIRGWQPNGAASLNMKVFLQGNFSGSNMATTLNQHNLLPLSQPFNFSPLNYNGTESVASIPNMDIVDWILMEFRDAATASSAASATAIGRKAAFVLKNGSIVDLDGISNLLFDYTISQNLFVVLWHRNHIGVMSATPLVKNNNVYQYDFSTGLEKVYNGSNCYKELIPGVWGMVGGDWNTSGIINLMDKAKWKIVSGGYGYNNSDYNLNGVVDNQDKNDIWIDNYGKVSSVP